MSNYETTPTKIIYSGVATIVFWGDGTKTVVKRAKGTKADNYNAFCAALAKKVYGTNSMTKKIINRAENYKAHRADGEIRVGDRVRILDGSCIPNYTAGWNCTMQKQVGRIGTVKDIDDWEEGDCRKAVHLKEFEFTYDMRGLKKV